MLEILQDICIFLDKNIIEKKKINGTDSVLKILQDLFLVFYMFITRMK